MLCVGLHVREFKMAATNRLKNEEKFRSLKRSKKACQYGKAKRKGTSH